MTRDTNHIGWVGKFVLTDKPRAYVDMDGVIANYHDARKASGLDYNDFNASHGAFANLPLLDYSHDGIKFLEEMGYEVWICTRPPHRFPQAYADKVEWLNHHFPSLTARVIMTPDKGCLGKSGDLLIDDHPDTNNGRNFGGTLIVHTDWIDTMNQITDLMVVEAISA